MEVGVVAIYKNTSYSILLVRVIAMHITNYTNYTMSCQKNE